MGEVLFSNQIKKFGETKGYKKTFMKSVNNLIYKENKDDEFTIDALIRLELLNNLKSINIGELLSVRNCFRKNFRKRSVLLSILCSK